MVEGSLDMGQFLSSLPTMLGGLLIAAATYWFTKKKEREAEWRKEKLVYYKEFIESLSGVVEGDSTPEGHRAFAKSVNNMMLFAPQNVLNALYKYRDATGISKMPFTRELHDKLLSELMYEIRKDIGVYPKDDAKRFEVSLWASGVGKRL
jgi:hypothetical protein